nr:hypothetical protein [Tanacetum cinerariifolium]
ADLKEVDGVLDQLPLFMGSPNPNLLLTHYLLEPLETMYNEAARSSLLIRACTTLLLLTMAILVHPGNVLYW